MYTYPGWKFTAGVAVSVVQIQDVHTPGSTEIRVGRHAGAKS